MLAYGIYKAAHIFGVLLVFLSLGGAIALAWLGTVAQPQARKALAITHGVGIVIVLVAGMGTLARLGLRWPFGTWLWIKVAIWAVLGGLLTLALRRPGLAPILWWVAPVLGVAAAWLAIAKP